MSGLSDLKTVIVELAYEDALRLWVLVHDPTNARHHRADERIQKLVNDAIKAVERDYEEQQEGLES